MKPLATSILAALILPLCAADEDLWITDLSAARKLAAKEKKDLLVNFTGSDWCPGCIMLEERVFSKEAFGKGMKDRFVLVKLDYPRDQATLEPAVIERNDLLLDQYFVQEFPTIILTDELGRPYAQTSLSAYEPQGVEDYVKHIETLGERRTHRDEAFSAAEKLAGVEKAKALQEAIADFPDVTVDAFYQKVVEEILAADTEDKTGFREARDYRKAVVGYEAVIGGLFDQGLFEEAIAAADAFIKDQDPTDFDLQHVLMAKLMAMVEIGSEETALKLLKEIKAIAPESEIGLEADRLRERIKTFFADQKATPAPPTETLSGEATAPGGNAPTSEDNERPPE